MDLKKIISKLTLEEKASICSGMDHWHTQSIERLNIPAVMVSDGPHGLRKQDDAGDHLGLQDSIKAICFPAACATACSFDRKLIYKLGEILGHECQAEGISVLLGPAVNIKRSPLCGRNFEYLSEDPYLSGELAASYIRGVQSQNIGTSIKHFAANNQENERMSKSSEVDERTLREIYLPSFETAVKKANPWTVMCSYNRINGTFASEDKRLLTDILRDEWGFDGYVVSDWGAVSNRVNALNAGLELEMPGNSDDNDSAIVDAVNDGIITVEALDTAVERILKINYRYLHNKKNETFNRDEDHAKAVEIAEQCTVLLKNDNILPLTDATKKIAFIGEFAEKPRYQGGGSSHINAYKVNSTVEMAKQYAPISYSKGFSSKEDKIDTTLFNEAIELGKNSDVVIVFAGLPDSFESEGYDRTHMALPKCQNTLISKLLKVQKNVIVVLHNGSPVEMPWVNDVRAVVEAYLGGEGIAEALAAILFGKISPGGKLAETFPIKLEDNPSYLNFPGTGEKVYYREGVFVGYRYYDTKRTEVLFPFGHGLSYTTFKLSNFKVSKSNIVDTENIEINIDVTNTGAMDGKEVVQLYVSDETGAAIRPFKELKEFEAVNLKPGETQTLCFHLNKRSFAWYNESVNDWYAASGKYTLLLGTSSRDIFFTQTINIASSTVLPLTVTRDTILGHLMRNPITATYVESDIFPLLTMFLDNQIEGRAAMLRAVVKDLPLRSLQSFRCLTKDQLENVVTDLNNLLQGNRC